MAALSEAVIQARGLTRRFGELTAVDSLDLSVVPGEIFGLVGPDGAGKTTTLRMLAGIMAPTSGEGRVAGCDLKTNPEGIRNHLAYMSQRFGLYPGSHRPGKHQFLRRSVRRAPLGAEEADE